MALNWSDGSPGTYYAESVAWGEGALPAQKEGAGREPASCGKAFMGHSNVF